MKTLIAVLLVVLLAVPLWAQDAVEIIVKPVVAMATIDSIRTVVGSKVIEMRGPAGNRFGSVSIGDYVWGVGIPWGTVVTDTVTTDSLLTLSKGATVTDTSGSTITGRAILNFSYYGGVTYQNGDFVGMPFEIPNSKDRMLLAVDIIDSSDTADSLDILLFDNPDYTATPIRDTVAASMTNADYSHLVGIVNMRTMTDLGDIRLIQETYLSMPIGQGKLYGRLISRKVNGMLLTSTQCLIIRFKFI